MPRRCVIGECSNSQCGGVSLHFWPKNEKIARKWDLFAQIKRADWIRGIPGVSTICGIHFTPSDYDGYGQWKAGLIKQLRLNSDAVPTVNVAVSGAPSATVTQPEPSQSRACAMIEINRSLAADTNKEDDSSSSVSDSDDSSSTSVSDVDVENSVCDKAEDKCGVSAGLVRNDGAFPRKNRKILRTAAEEAKAHAVFLSQLKFSRDIACQTDYRQKISVATQYIPQLNRSYGTQVSWTRRLTKSQGTQISVLSVSVGIGTPFQWKRPPPVQSSTFRKPFLPSKRRRLKLDDGESVLTEGTLSQASHSINHVPTYVVDEDCLLQLFEECPVCGSMCEVQKTTIETFLTIHQLCPQCHFNRNWKSQQMEKAVPSDDVHSCTSDPESSAITAIVGFSDENDSSDEGQSSEVDGGDCNSDSDWDPVEHQNGDIELADSESDADGRHDVAFRQLCPECGKYFFRQTHTCENKKPYSCNVCGKRYVCEVTLKAHSKVHEDGYKHVCKYCLSTFRMRADKLAHEKRHPPRKQPYQCPDCPRVFAKIEERRKHLLSHRGPKKHICSMEFFCPGSLERHMVVHTKAKQFVCEVCQRSFTQTNHLKSHMRVHTGEKPYQCQHCNKSFNHNVSLKSHIQRYHGQVPDPGEKVLLEKTSRNESEAEKNETQEMESSAVDAEEVERSKDTLCNAGNGGDEEKVKKRRRATGRPRGRPKKKAVITSDDVNQLKRQICIRDENEEGQGNLTFPDHGENVQMEKTSWNESEVEKDETNVMESSDADAEKAKTDEMESSGVDTDEAAERSNTLCNPDDDEQLQRVLKKKRYKYKSTGRPRGRPKKNTLLTLDYANQLKRPLYVGDENDKRQGNSTDEERELDSDFEPVM